TLLASRVPTLPSSEGGHQTEQEVLLARPSCYKYLQSTPVRRSLRLQLMLPEIRLPRLSARQVSACPATGFTARSRVSSSEPSDLSFMAAETQGSLAALGSCCSLRARASTIIESIELLKACRPLRPFFHPSARILLLSPTGSTTSRKKSGPQPGSCYARFRRPVSGCAISSQPVIRSSFRRRLRRWAATGSGW